MCPVCLSVTTSQLRAGAKRLPASLGGARSKGWARGRARAGWEAPAALACKGGVWGHRPRLTAQAQQPLWSHLLRAPGLLGLQRGLGVRGLGELRHPLCILILNPASGHRAFWRGAWAREQDACHPEEPGADGRRATLPPWGVRPASRETPRGRSMGLSPCARGVLAVLSYLPPQMLPPVCPEGQLGPDLRGPRRAFTTAAGAGEAGCRGASS